MLYKQQQYSHMEQFETELYPEHEKMKPYISFVTVARNDDHGGNFLERMQVFISALLQQIKKHNLNAELIIVDWNPPADRPKLSQVLSLSFSSELFKNIPCKIRIIEVPSEMHKRFQYFDKIALFQMIGKNVGIRRAHGEYVVATNVDLLFSDDLIKSLASKSLKPEFFYRIDRYDVDGIPNGDSILEQIDYCEHNLIRVHRKDGSFSTLSTRGIFLFKCKVSLQHFRKYFLSNIQYGSSVIQTNFKEGCSIIQTNFKEGCSIIQTNFKEGCSIIQTNFKEGCSIIQTNFRNARAAFSLYNQGAKEIIHFYQKNRKHYKYSVLMKMTKIVAELAGKGIYLVGKQAGKGIYLVGKQAANGIYLVGKLTANGIYLVGKLTANGIYLVGKLTANGIYLVGKLAVRGIASLVTKTAVQLKNMIFPSYPKLHTNGCGDFTVMTKEKWHDLRGYPELEIFSFNIDSIILQMAYEDGLREKILKDPLRMYHMEHDSGWTPESSDNLIKRLKDKRIPFFSFEKFVRLASKMHTRKNPMVSNKEGWGLGSETLPEVCIN